MSKYQPISPFSIDLSTLGITEAIARGLPPAFVYDLHVGPWLATSARLLVQRELSGTNPLSPHVNVNVDAELAREEWYIESNGVRIGSNPTP
jgi:hypothetical protein